MPYLTQTDELPRDTRMTLVHDEYLSEWEQAGLMRFRAGTVLMVDAQTATRWRRKGIAVDSAETDKTIREQKAAELARLQAEIAALAEEENSPAPSPARPVASTRRLAVSGVGQE